MLFFRLISTAVGVPSAEHRACIPSCYANVSSGTSLHRHTPCIFWGKCHVMFMVTFRFKTAFKDGLSLSLSVCRYTSPDMCFHLRCLASCLRCPLPIPVLRCTCPCSHTCLLGQWVRTCPWPTIKWGLYTPMGQQWWWRVALTLALASQVEPVSPSQWVTVSHVSRRFISGRDWVCTK